MPIWLSLMVIAGLLSVPASAKPATTATGSDRETVGERTFPAFSGMSDSKGGAAPVILHGTLKSDDGAALGNAEVLLLAHPSVEAKRAIPEGGTFEPTPLARTFTDGDGHYELRAEYGTLAQMRHGADGLDLELDVFSHGRHLVTFEQVRHDPASGGWSRVTPEPQEARATHGRHAGNRADVAFDFQRYGAVTDLSSESPVAQQAVPRHHQGAYIGGCSPYELKATLSSLETVAVGLVENGVKTWAKYNTSASTTSGMGWAVGVNGSWAGVSWSQNNTKTRTSGFTASFLETTAPIGGTAHREYRVTWEHKRYERHCSDGAGGYQMQTYTEPTIALGGAGDYSSRYGVFTCHTTASVNVTYIETTNATATSYGTAFTITSGPGSFSGSAQSNYTSYVVLRYTFNGAGKWCGNNAAPTSAGRVRGWK